MLTVDFYGENIFRLFRDDNGGIVRNPVAAPPAQILVDGARRSPMKVDLQNEGAQIVVTTPRIAVTFHKANGTMCVKDLKTGNIVVEEVAPVSFDKNSTTLTFLGSVREKATLAKAGSSMDLLV